MVVLVLSYSWVILSDFYKLIGYSASSFKQCLFIEIMYFKYLFYTDEFLSALDRWQFFYNTLIAKRHYSQWFARSSLQYDFPLQAVVLV